MLAQAVGDDAQDLIAGQMSEPVVHLLEAIQIANDHGERGSVALRARHFVVERQKQRSRIGQTGQVIGRDGSFEQPVLSAFSIASATLELIASRMRRFSLLKASRSAR